MNLNDSTISSILLKMIKSSKIFSANLFDNQYYKNKSIKVAMSNQQSILRRVIDFQASNYPPI